MERQYQISKKKKNPHENEWKPADGAKSEYLDILNLF